MKAEVEQMNDKELKFNIGEPVTSASHDTAAIDIVKDEDRNRRKSFMKLLVVGFMLIVVVVFGAMGWFATNRNVSAGDMGMKVQAMPYTIQTRNSSGYYSNVYESLETGAMEWKISSDYNFENHESAKNEDEEEPVLEPGDSGILEFRVNPNTSETITVNCVFDVKAYIETEDENTQEKVITEINNQTLVNYIKAHILLFSGYNSESGKYTDLIDNDESLRRVLMNKTYSKNGDDYTKIYWVWPKYLDNLTSSSNSEILYASSERDDVIKYIARNRDGFFKDCNDSETKVISDLTELSVSYSNAIYNHYNMGYDNADLEIGNNISYVMISMKVE